MCSEWFNFPFWFHFSSSSWYPIRLLTYVSRVGVWSVSLSVNLFRTCQVLDSGRQELLDIIFPLVSFPFPILWWHSGAGDTCLRARSRARAHVHLNSFVCPLVCSPVYLFLPNILPSQSCQSLRRSLSERRHWALTFSHNSVMHILLPYRLVSKCHLSRRFPISVCLCKCMSVSVCVAARGSLEQTQIHPLRRVPVSHSVSYHLQEGTLNCIVFNCQFTGTLLFEMGDRERGREDKKIPGSKISNISVIFPSNRFRRMSTYAEVRFTTRLPFACERVCVYSCACEIFMFTP